MLPYKGYLRKRHKNEPTDSYFYIARHISKCMTRDDAFNLRVNLVLTEMTCTQHIPISYVCDSDERKSKGILVDEKLSKFYYTDESESESVIVNENSTEESESESGHKSINTKN